MTKTLQNNGAGRMRTVFFGSAAISIPPLEKLLAEEGVVVAAAVTQPDRPAGRRRRLTPCPLKCFARERGLPVLSPEKIGDAVADLADLRADLFAVVAYGQYLPSSILELPPCGAINLHPSLLPNYRGASPIQWAVANGDRETGVSILYVSEKMDAGDLILQQTVPIGPEDTSLTMEPVLAACGADLMVEAVRQIRAGTAARIRQDEAAVTETRKLTKADGCLDWTCPAETLRNRIRGFVPWPGCYCDLPEDGGRLKVLRATVEPGNGEPGEVLDGSGPGPLIAAADKALRLLEVQPAGKKPMDGAAFLRGHPLSPGLHLETGRCP